LSTPAPFFSASPVAAASEGIDFAPPIDSQGRIPPKGINVACIFPPDGSRGLGFSCGWPTATGRAVAEGIDFAAELLPKGSEQCPQLLEEACKPAAIPPGCRGRALRGRRHRRHQSQTQTHQNNEGPKRPHTHPFAGDQAGRASTDCAAAPQGVWCSEREDATVELTRRVIRFLHRSQHDPELKFETSGDRSHGT
jgi:hypothetical protein